MFLSTLSYSMHAITMFYLCFVKDGMYEKLDSVFYLSNLHIKILTLNYQISLI